MPTQIVVIAGPDKGRAFALTAGDACVIGRGSQSHTRLVDPAISRLHCQVRFEGDQAVLTDADSASGTTVNQQRVVRHALRPGDVIQVGNTQLRFEHEVADDSTLLPGMVAAPAPAAAPEVVFANRPGSRILPKPLKVLQQLAGKTLGSYQLLEVLGIGQVGVVFKARDGKDQELVALKVLRSDFALDQKAMQRFIRGMMTVRNLTHPHLVELYNAGITGPHAWIAMELVEGPSLAALMPPAAPRPDWRQAQRIARDIGQALDFMHQRGLLHRGVVPQNILVRKSDGAAKLGDAMLAKALEGNTVQEVTASGEFVGNLYYMAPERTLPGAEIDGRADLYSLGVTLYALIAGRMPFAGQSMADVVGQIRHTAPPSLRSLDPAVPEAFSAVVARLLAKRPEERYASAAALVADLER